MSSKLIPGQASRAFWAASMKSLVASVAKMSLRTLVLGLSSRPVPASKNCGFSARWSLVSSSTAV